MSTESCSSSPRLDYNKFLKDVTWVNEDYPEANMALLEGLRYGFTGYAEDKIIESQPAKRMKGQTGCIEGNLPSSTDELEDAAQKPFDFEAMEQILRDTRPVSPPPRNTSPLKRNSALTVRPTIGEERRAWLLEAQRAYCLNELQNNGVLTSSSEMFYRKATTSTASTGRCVQARRKSSDYAVEQTSASCPDLETRREPVHANQQCECNCNSARSTTGFQDRESSVGSIDEKDSCEFLFQHVEGCFKPSKIRLSPRIEKLGNYKESTQEQAFIVIPCRGAEKDIDKI